MDQSKKAVKSFSGLALLVFIAIAAVAYFSDRVSVNSFGTLAFVVAVAALVLAYFGWMAVRAGALVVVIAGILLGGVVFSKHPSVKSGQYQAVFLTNGQVYFGNLNNADAKNPVLNNVYYLQSPQQNSQTGGSQSTTPSNDVTLVKLDSALHGPEDTMILKGNQILFWENLKNSGKVAQLIKQDQQKK